MKKIVFLVTSCKKSGPIQQTLNIIKNLDRSLFEPHLITLYPEEEDSQLDLYLPHVAAHRYVPTSKVDILTGRVKRLRDAIDELKPDVIHSLGVFPDYALSRMKHGRGRLNEKSKDVLPRWKQICTLRNFIYDDYPTKFGPVLGHILAWLHLYAMKRTTKTVACSESLAGIYDKRLHLKYDFVRNGVDVEQYSMPSSDEADAIRKELNLPQEAFVFVYTGQIIERKNLDFLLSTFAARFDDSSVYLLLLGDGDLLPSYRDKYGHIGNIDFRGGVPDVSHYLKACDAYLSASRSEGLPNGVLEAMACGLPVVLSDIEQHLEIYNVNSGIGEVFRQDDADDLVKGMKSVMANAESMGAIACQVAHSAFSASEMSRKYQDIYLQMCRE